MKERKLLFSIRIGESKTPSNDLKVPEYLKERFARLELDTYLDPDMGKYILYFADGWGYPMSSWELWGSIPVMSKKEAIEYLKEAIHEDEKMRRC